MGDEGAAGYLCGTAEGEEWFRGFKALFENSNIAVYLGKASCGLCALDFDRDEDFAEFLKRNPKLEKTTRSRGSRGGMLWVRISGGYPESCNASNFEWRADNRLSTIYGKHPKGMMYELVCDFTSVTIPLRKSSGQTGRSCHGKIIMGQGDAHSKTLWAVDVGELGWRLCLGKALRRWEVGSKVEGRAAGA